MQKFFDRAEAGAILAEHLKKYQHQSNVIVIALPRGGVPVAHEISTVLAAPLDIIVVRKLGVPWHDELAMGAIASGGSIIFNKEIIKNLHIAKSDIDHVIQVEQAELQRRELVYRGARPFPALKNKIVILVDDGIATGATMRAAIKALREHNPAKIIVAIPVAAKETYDEIKKLVDEIVCPLTPINFNAVGSWYENFSQTTDEEVFRLLAS